MQSQLENRLRTQIGNDMMVYEFALEYLQETWGHKAAGEKMTHMLMAGHRFGQAFYNALTPEDQLLLVATNYDPFHKTGASCVWVALDWLNAMNEKDLPKKEK